MKKGSRRDMILAALRAGDMTCEELQEPSGLNIAQLATHLSQLAHNGYVRRLSEKRANKDGGRPLTVWAINEDFEPTPKERELPGKRRDQVLSALRTVGDKGMTCEELSEHVSLDVNSLPSYLINLERLGFVRVLPRKRRNKIGRATKVWALAANGPEVTADSRPADFWADIRKRIAEYVKSKSENMSEVVFDQVFRDFEIDMRDLVNTFQNRLKQKQLPVPEVVSRRAVFDACRTLQIDTPKVNGLVDEVAAKRNKRQLVRVYHPDATHVANDTTRAMYEAVIAAYETIIQYNDSIRSKKNGT